MFIPSFSKSIAPLKVPSPPIATTASTLFFLKLSAACFLNFSSKNLSLLLVYKIVPPRLFIFLTSSGSNFIVSQSISPSYPLKIPTTSIPKRTALNTTALIAEFIPGASPPLVKTAIFLISLILFFSS